MKPPKTFEQYILRRIDQLERENENLRNENRWKSKTIDVNAELIEKLESDLELLVGRIQRRQFGDANIFDFDDVWDTHNPEEYKKITKIVERYSKEQADMPL